jgi:transcriptional regulator with XRE-family HTH domain
MDYRQNRQPLFEILDARGIKRSWLAAKLGMHRNYLYLVERGRRPFPVAKRTRAAEVLGLPESLLFRIEPAKRIA